MPEYHVPIIDLDTGAEETVTLIADDATEACAAARGLSGFDNAAVSLTFAEEHLDMDTDAIEGAFEPEPAE